jgi:arylformamidase
VTFDPALDAQYDTSRQLPDGNVAPYFEAFVRESEAARTRLHCDLDIRYGPHERETFDFFHASANALDSAGGPPGAPLFVFVHGGYWRRMSKREFSFVAGPLVEAGVAVATLNYPLAPEAKLDTIVASVRAGYAFALRHAAELGAAPGPAVVGGHSVGAQLAGMIAASNEVRGLFTLSGLYDLEPLRSTHINDWIAMDAESARRNGPLHNPPLGTGVPLIAAAGEREQAEFHRQQREYAAAWNAWGGSAREVPAPGLDHFSIVLELARRESPLTRSLLALLGRG